MKTLKQFLETVIRYEMAPKKKALAKRSSSSAGGNGNGDGGDGGNGGGNGGE